MINQKLAKQEQDQHLDEIMEISDQLKSHALNINQELGHQEELINQMDTEIDKVNTKMTFVEKKLSVLLKTHDRGQLCTIMILTLVLLVMMFFTFYLQTLLSMIPRCLCQRKQRKAREDHVIDDKIYDSLY